MLRLGRERDRLRVVDDQHGAPTTSHALADATRGIVGGVVSGHFGETNAWAGLYHMSCGGETTWCGFARAIFARAGPLLQGRRPAVDAIASSEYPTPARRPRNSVLSNALLRERFGVALPGWEDALNEVVARLTAEAHGNAGKDR
jgi:dTDP-4-dehydrorhamnose reductase